jgi:hypothetical protein
MGTVYVLLMLMWTPSMHTAGAVTSAEFANKASCIAAAQSAEKKFNGWGSTLYWTCEPKDMSSPVVPLR